MGRGVLLLLLSSAAFATSGALARGLLDAGWTPGAAVLVRVGGAALVLLGVVLVWRRRELAQLRRARRTVVVYGVVAVAGVQLCYFTAVQTLSVGVALLLEYLAPVIVVAWLWLRRGRRPERRVVVGGAVALVGTAGVLDVLGGARVDPVGVLWALAAAAGLAIYFLVLGAGADQPEERRVDPVVLASGGMAVGAVALGLAAAAGVLPVRVTGGSAELAGAQVPLWVPVTALVLVSTVLAYAAGAAGVARLGATAGSLVGLSEVVAAVAIAWLLLGQLPSAVQLVGGALVLVGVAITQAGRRSPAPPTGTTPAVAAAAPAG